MSNQTEEIKEEIKPTRIEYLASSQRGASVDYRVNISGLEVSDDELITRCDNRTWNMQEDAGQKCHFGGHVKRGETETIVTVWID